MDFSEGDFDGAFQFWNICNGKAKKKLELPADWQNLTYAKDETLPAAKINKGVATIKVKTMLFSSNWQAVTPIRWDFPIPM